MTEGASGAGGKPAQVAQATKEQAAGVSSTAKEAGTQVASSAMEQGKHVATEAKAQARDLLGEARGQASTQAVAQKDKAVTGLRSVADELGSMADGQSGIVSEFAKQASTRAHSLADWVDVREPADLLEDVRDFARRKPGAFLLGAAIAGIVAGRLTRGTVAATQAENSTPTPALPATGYEPAALTSSTTGTDYGTGTYATGTGTYAGGTGGYGTTGTTAGAGYPATDTEYSSTSYTGSGVTGTSSATTPYGTETYHGERLEVTPSADAGSAYTDLGSTLPATPDVDVRGTGSEVRP